MIKCLSILIPTFNDVCLPMAEELVRQARAIADWQWEIVVAEDGSTDAESLAQNRRIATMEGCRYFRREKNVGRAAVRNWLAQEACYDNLLFVDAGLSFPDAEYLSRYVQAPEAEVVCGGVAVAGKHPGNLRYLYETASQGRFMAEQRQREPYQHFRTTNFMIRRSVMLAHPLREDMKTYGYEDVLFGKTLAQSQVSIAHIDNPVVYVCFEPNAIYINKVEESLRTLYAYRGELQGYSPLLSVAGKLQRSRMRFLVTAFYGLFGKPMRRNLAGKHPWLCLFNPYKLGYFCTLCTSKRKKRNKKE